MSTSATGRLVDENGAPWAGFTVAARDTDPIFVDEDLGSRESGANGRFTLSYEPDQFAATHGPRTIEFDVLDKVHRRLTRIEREDVSAASLELGDVVIRRKDATGYLVTLGTGNPQRLTPDNTVHLLIDNERAWERVKALMDRVRNPDDPGNFRPRVSLDVMQLTFEVPERNRDNERDEEEPVLVLEFPEDVPAPSKDDVAGSRPEVMLVRAAQVGTAVRILVNRFQLEGHALAASLTMPGVGLVLALLGGLACEMGFFTTADNVFRYFLGPSDSSGAPDEPLENVTVVDARNPAFGPMHAKLFLADADDARTAAAIMLASPFEQAYFGSHPHSIDDPRRGDSTREPIHEVSVEIHGPAVADLQTAFKLHWDDDADDPVPQMPRPAKESPPGGFVSAVQVVNTLPDSFTREQGILEAYLRAIAMAERFLYLENQFFTSDTIADALVRALKDPARPELQVIALLNINPDSWFYPRWQRKLIVRMREALNDFERARFGVFTRWTHEPPKPPARPRPRIAPCYLHSKVALADDKWATIGSANLDGTSLDVTHFFRGLTFGDVRATEVNCMLFNGVDGQPDASVVVELRHRLWAEHLGFVDEEGNVDFTAEELHEPPVGGWLALWDERANLKRDQLRSDPATLTPSAILAWPEADRTLKHPREHLEAALGAKLTTLEPIEGTRRYSFEKGEFVDSRPEVDS